MAGQSEGVGVLVAIFVTLAVLGVGAAVYLWLELDKAKLSQAAAEQSKSEADQLAGSLQTDLSAIRAKIDHAEGSAQEAIERLTTMIQRYNGDNPDQRVQVAFEYQSTQIQNLRTQVQELNSNLQETNDKLKAIEIEHKEYVKTHQGAKEQAQRQTQVLMTEKEQQRKDKDTEIDRLIKEREDAVRRERQLERDITAERKEMGLKLELVRRKLAQAVEQIKGDGGGRLFEGPDGVVLRASARLGLAYINLGVEDRVRPGMTFSVYAYGVEVGLGGRLDSTNVIDADYTAISSLSYDHTHLLGDRLSDIAREKAGIVKGRPTVIGPEPMADQTILASAVNNVDHPPSELWQVGQQIRVAHHGFDSPFAPARLDIVTPYSEYLDVQLPLWGKHQARNAALAVGLVDLMRETSANELARRIDEPAVREGLATVECPARVEYFRGRPPVILDTCHNVASAQALVRAITDRLPDAPWRLVLGLASDKDAAGICQVFAPHCRHVIATQADSPRSLPAVRLADIAMAAGIHTTLASTSPHALDAARSGAEEGELLVVAGSFYLAGELRPQIVDG